MMPSIVQISTDNLFIPVTNFSVRQQYRRCANV
jgi:hypothetical protein